MLSFVIQYCNFIAISNQQPTFALCFYFSMLKRTGNIIISCLLIVALSLNGTSHELIHLFLDHEDTKDCLHDYHESQEHTGAYTFFDTEHHHCDFLTLNISFFVAESYTQLHHNLIVHEEQYVNRQLSHVELKAALQQHLRGPPTATQAL